MLTLDDEWGKAHDMQASINELLRTVPSPMWTKFAKEWEEIELTMDAAYTKARALRDKIAAMKE